MKLNNEHSYVMSTLFVYNGLSVPQENDGKSSEIDYILWLRN